MNVKSWSVLDTKNRDVMDRDDILSKFIDHTHVEPSLASDLLDATEWDLTQALTTFEGMKDIYVCTEVIEQEPVTPPTTPLSPGNVGVGVVKGRGSRTKRRGLAAVGEEATRDFYKAATSMSAGKSGQQVTFEEQFFAHSFRCLDFGQFEEEFQEFLADDIVEKSHKYALEKAGLLNWWTSDGKLPQLVPLATSGDGNCLLHAASLYMWGLQDQQLILRNSLHKLLTSGPKKDAIFKRWRHVTELRNKEAGGLTFSEQEWDFEWAEIMRIANSKPRRTPSTESLRRYSTLRLNYESLEEIHVFALAHVLKRPIVVVADNVLRGILGDELAPVYFGGIYLPLEESTCCKYPVVLTFDASHFAALVAKDDDKRGRTTGKREFESVIPLVTSDGKLLPLRFDIEAPAPGKNHSDEYDPHAKELLEKYLNILWINQTLKCTAATGDADSDYDHLPSVKRIPAALIGQQQIPIYQQTLVQNYIDNARSRFEEWKLAQQQLEGEKRRREDERRKKEEEQQMRIPVPCQGKDCTMFGTPATKFLCSRCAKLILQGECTSTAPQPTSDVATPSSPGVNPSQISGYGRQSSKNEISAQPSHNSSTSKQIPPPLVLQGLNPNSVSSKVQAPPSPPKPAVLRQDSNKAVTHNTQNVSSSARMADQPKKVPLEPPKRIPQDSPKKVPQSPKSTTMSETKIETGLHGVANKSPTKLKPAAGRVLHVQPKGSYSRDAVQPLTANDKGTCATDGCGFYASGQSKYCTKCRAADSSHS